MLCYVLPARRPTATWQTRAAHGAHAVYKVPSQVPCVQARTRHAAPALVDGAHAVYKKLLRCTSTHPPCPPLSSLWREPLWSAVHSRSLHLPLPGSGTSFVAPLLRLGSARKCLGGDDFNKNVHVRLGATVALFRRARRSRYARSLKGRLSRRRRMPAHDGGVSQAEASPRTRPPTPHRTPPRGPLLDLIR